MKRLNILFAMLFFINMYLLADDLNQLENELKTLANSLNVVQQELEALDVTKPSVFQLPQEVKIETSINMEASVQKNIDLVEELTKQTKEQLGLVWETFKSEKFRESIKDWLRKQFPYAALKASVAKGIPLKGPLIDPKVKEGSFLSKRVNTAARVVEKFTGKTLKDNDEMPRIACAFSGGGYRAMILTSGYLKALEELGLLDAILYCASLSGSTWYLGPWTFQQELGKKTSVNDFNNLIIEKIKNNRFDLKDTRNVIDFDVPLFATKVIWPKVLFNQVISSVDIYGAELAYFLLADLGKERQERTLYDQLSNVATAHNPWPIYTAVSMHKSDDPKTPYRYNWYEFNPAEVRNLEYDLSIPSYAFGRKFENGISVDNAPPQSFGFMMGVFGSAYTVNLADGIRILFGAVKPPKTDEAQEKLLSEWFKKPQAWAKAGILEIKSFFGMALKGQFSQIYNQAKDDFNQVAGALLVRFLGFVEDVVIKVADVAGTVTLAGYKIKVKSARFSPAQIFNPFKEYEDINQPWLQEREFLTFVDGGIDYNIPLRPLFRPERDLDVIIIGDSSGDVIAGTLQLDLALKDIERFYGLEYTKDEKKSDKTCMIYTCKQSSYPKAGEEFKEIVPPTLIYINFLNDNKLMDEKIKDDPMLKKVIDENNLYAFDAIKCFPEAFCGTFNFNYTEKDYKQLSGIGEFNVLAHKDMLKSIIAERLDDRIKHPEFGGGG